MFITVLKTITGAVENSGSRRVFSGCLPILFLSIIFLGSGLSSAQTPNVQSEGNLTQSESLASSVEQAAASEKENLDLLKQKLEMFQVQAREIDQEIEKYNAKIAAHGSFLHLNDARIEDLQNIRSEISAALGLMSQRLSDLRKERDELDHALDKVEERLALNSSHLDEMASEKPRSKDRENLLAQLRVLTRLLKEKRKATEQLRNLYSDKLARLEDALRAYQALDEEYQLYVRQKKKEVLFKRKFGPLTLSAWYHVRSELADIEEKARKIVSADYWSRQFGTIEESGLESFLPLVILFALVQYIAWRLLNLLGRLVETPQGRRHFWWIVSLDVFRGSLPLLGATVFLYSYTLAKSVYPGIPVIRLLVQLLIVWLFTQWCLRFLKSCTSAKKPNVLQPLLPSLRLFVLSVRVFASAYLAAQWFLGESSTILLLARFLLEVGLVIWCSRFSMRLKRKSVQRRGAQEVQTPGWKGLVSALSYVISLGGIMMELSGYGSFALYWYTCWGRTAVILLWAVLLFLSLRSWNRKLKEMVSVTGDHAHVASPPLQWFLTRLCALAWAGLLLMSLLMGWGAGYSFLFKTLAALKSPIPIGSISFSLLSLVYAFVTLVITHAVARLSKSFLLTRFLADSGLQAGLQESITKITGYTIWVLGILLSLNVLGFSTASMAVGLGALGIGLGFGLQNIFNNFVSGLILLFERPIQVGDALEINGIWGVVRKINVRSTVVQTWDNASLIIPNSEFVSSQVTNWSFQDMRLRRKIEVGVAYGSDVQLVKRTLLEAAENNPKVLKDPPPDVLFTDFADSALLFTLRFWTTVDVSLSTQTDLRFEIDRLFRERKILIPFPQRDVRIYSTVETEKERSKEED